MSIITDALKKAQRKERPHLSVDTKLSKQPVFGPQPVDQKPIHQKREKKPLPRKKNNFLLGSLIVAFLLTLSLSLILSYIQNTQKIYVERTVPAVISPSTSAVTTPPVITPADKPLPVTTPVNKPVPVITQADKPVPVTTQTDKQVPVITQADKPVQVTTPIDKPIPVTTPIDKPVPVTTQADKPAKEKNSFRLSGIVYDEINPMAIINDRIVEIGKAVDGAEVTEINDEFVNMSYRGEKITLYLESKK